MSKIITEPKIHIAPEILKNLKTECDEQGQVILHVLYHAPMDFLFALIRIWPTTYLYDHHSDHRSKLLHVENITMFPDWFPCRPGQDNYFSLIFSSLPSSCTAFDFIEHCNNSGGEFEVRNIQRNKTDVYFVQI